MNYLLKYNAAEQDGQQQGSGWLVGCLKLLMISEPEHVGRRDGSEGHVTLSTPRCLGTLKRNQSDGAVVDVHMS